jgi:hypothetical protein
MPFVQLAVAGRARKRSKVKFTHAAASGATLWQRLLPLLRRTPSDARVVQTDEPERGKIRAFDDAPHFECTAS